MRLAINLNLLPYQKIDLMKEEVGVLVHPLRNENVQVKDLILTHDSKRKSTLTVISMICVEAEVFDHHLEDVMMISAAVMAEVMMIISSAVITTDLPEEGTEEAVDGTIINLPGVGMWAIEIPGDVTMVDEVVFKVPGGENSRDQEEEMVFVAEEDLAGAVILDGEDRVEAVILEGEDRVEAVILEDEDRAEAVILDEVLVAEIIIEVHEEEMADVVEEEVDAVEEEMDQIELLITGIILGQKFLISIILPVLKKNTQKVSRQ